MKALVSVLAVAVVCTPAYCQNSKKPPMTIVGAAQPASAPSQGAAPAAATKGTGPAAVVPVVSVASVPQPVAAVAGLNGPDANGRYMLRDGDDVPLVFAEDISSKTAAEGDPVAFTLAEDLTVGGMVVAKAGCKAVGEVSRAEHSGMMGKPGQLSIRLEYLKVGDAKVHLRGTKGKEGGSGTTSTIVLTVLFGPIGLIKHGKNIEIKHGASFKAYVSDDTGLLPVV